MSIQEKITIPQAKEILGIHENTIRDFCKSGKLTAKKLLNHRWAIEKKSVEKLLNESK